MFYVYSVPNYNPALGAVKDGKQSVSVYDRNLGNRRIVVTTPEEADAYITARKELLEKSAKRGLVDIPLVATAGAVLGAGVSTGIDYFENVKLNELAKEATALLKEMMKKVKDPLKSIESIKYDLLHDNVKFKDYWLKLSNLFSKESNEFKAMDIAKAMKKSAKTGALFGAALGLCLGFWAPSLRTENADKKITNAFIENNKFGSIDNEE